MSFGIWLVSLDYLNTLTIDEICDRKCGSRHPRSGTFACHCQTGRRNVQGDMSHTSKSPREIYANKPTA